MTELVFVPLGGVGEIGMNFALYGYGPKERRQWLIVDCGVTFPGPDLPGVDLVLPDIRFIEAERKNLRKGVKVVTAGAPPAPATIERMEGDLGWHITQVYGLTETAPLITICEPLPAHDALTLAERAQIKARQGIELITSGETRVVDEQMNDVAADGQTMGEIVARGNVVMKGYYNDPEATDNASFRAALKELTQMLVYEATRSLACAELPVQTPVAATTGSCTSSTRCA